VNTIGFDRQLFWNLDGCCRFDRRQPDRVVITRSGTLTIRFVADLPWELMLNQRPVGSSSPSPLVTNASTTSTTTRTGHALIPMRVSIGDELIVRFATPANTMEPASRALLLLEFNTRPDAVVDHKTIPVFESKTIATGATVTSTSSADASNLRPAPSSTTKPEVAPKPSASIPPQPASVAATIAQKPLVANSQKPVHKSSKAPEANSAARVEAAVATMQQKRQALTGGRIPRPQ
jgi:hypothetical protein